jgi:hypothetical protein
MKADTQAQVAFFLTGRRPAEYLDAVDGLDLRPALFAGYEDLTALRYDFPIVLVAQAAAGANVESLSGLFDKALEKVAQGADAERIRKHGLRLEQEIRVMVAAGTAGRLSTLWESAAARISAQGDPTFDESQRRLRTAVKVDGELADCDAALPPRLLCHVWEAAQSAKSAQFRQRLKRLVLKLSAILQADVEKSVRGVAADRLQATMGPCFASAMDFEAMSRLLTKSQRREAMPAARKRRITELLRVLKAQRFYADGAAEATVQGYGFVFNSCSSALKAYRERLPKLVEMARALVIAELEIDGQYSLERHDAVFEAYGAAGLDVSELTAFPDYLVCIADGGLDAQENTRLMELLSSGLPIKVLLQVDDLTDSTSEPGLQAPGMRSRQLAGLAMGLNEVYVLQSSASNLFQFRERMHKGVTYRGPALISVYSGANAKAAGIPPYLMAAAAMESRAFPAFTYDPSAGANWAARFCLRTNSQVDLDWPVKGFAYEDEQHQGVMQDIAFTVVDFLAADSRYAGQLARVPREKWNGSMIAIDETLARERKGLPDKVPSLLMVDGQNRLQKVLVTQSLIRQASRCREMWHSLQELGGIHNSHAEQLLAREQKAWEERMRKEAEATSSVSTHAVVQPAAAAAAPSSAAPAAAEVLEEPERNPDEAYIETERCSTCNECTQLNNKMFAYNANQQAYIADIDAGTYAQMVEAAESCQVAVIHPGKPRNPNEPGLEALLKRAEAVA